MNQRHARVLYAPPSTTSVVSAHFCISATYHGLTTLTAISLDLSGYDSVLDGVHVLIRHHSVVPLGHPRLNMHQCCSARLGCPPCTHPISSSLLAFRRQTSLSLVVEATSPRETRYERMKEVFAARFYMRPWSFLEVCQAYVDFSPWTVTILMITPLQPHTCCLSPSPGSSPLLR